MSHYIYVLQLQENKWYIGRVSPDKKIEDRLKLHKEGIACPWTVIHKYTDFFEAFLGSPYDEDKTTLEYMDKYGIENVRGGIYSEPELSLEQYMSIIRHIRGSNNACFACGDKNHFIANCNSIICYRCGRIGHSALLCTEFSHIQNGKLNGCYRCGRPDHKQWRCNRSKDIYGRLLDVSYFTFFNL